MSAHEVDVLVIGAGPAGTIAASLVHQAGFRVAVVEKTRFPRFVIGESLLPRCMEALEEAGFLDAVKEAGFQEKFGAKFVKQGRICDYSFAERYTEGWTWTWQVPRADFDTILADEVARMGVPVHYEHTVTGVDFHAGGSEITVEDPEGRPMKFKARFIIDGSGYGRVLPRLLHLDRPSSLPPRMALFAHLEDPNRSAADEPNRITILVHAPGVWVWVIPFSNGLTSVGFVGSPEFFAPLAGSPEEKLRALIARESHIRDRFANVPMAWTPRTLEGWSVATERFYGDGFVLTGNVTEFLDPVFSSGVTLAAVSSQLAGRLVVRTLKGETLDWEKEYTAVMMQGVETFRAYVNAWYEGTLDTIFFSRDQIPEYKRKICSVLAGYVWDTSNEFVARSEIMLKKLARIIELTDGMNLKSS